MIQNNFRIRRYYIVANSIRIAIEHAVELLSQWKTDVVYVKWSNTVEGDLMNKRYGLLQIVRGDQPREIEVIFN